MHLASNNSIQAAPLAARLNSGVGHEFAKGIG